MALTVACDYWPPGWWGWGGSGFIFHVGFWGPVVGFYGGINYGFGYFGHGYEGGRWDNGRFFYNRTVNNINVTNIHNVDNTTVVNTTTVNRISYNGGSGGVTAQPTPQEEAAARERHIPPVSAQTQHMEAARSNPQRRVDEPWKPPIPATPTPAAFQGDGVVAAKEAGGPYAPPPANRAASAVHPTICRLLLALLLLSLAALSRTRNTSSNKRSSTPSSSRNEKSCSGSRTRSTSNRQNSRLMRRGSSN